MTAEPATRVVLLTPEGRGAVASLLVDGPSATPLVDELFHSASGRRLAGQPIDRLLYGRWLSAAVGEEVIVCSRGQQRLEVHCHGGAAAARAIVESLVRRGCLAMDWRDWTRRSTDDPIVAEAQILLARAPTQRTAAILWEQHNGALRGALDAIVAQLTAGDANRAIRRVDELVAWVHLGRHLVEPWRVVLAGRPNVGKSSLINALLGYERAIVHDTPGTTRDVVSAATAIDGWPIELTDTAGLHASDQPLERAGIELARGRLAACDLTVLIFDASSQSSADDETLRDDWPEALRVYNKCDLLEPKARDDFPPPCLLTSATGGEGIAELQCAIAGRLVPRSPEPGQAVPFRSEQVEALEQVRDLLMAARIGEAKAVLAGQPCWTRATC